MDSDRLVTRCRICQSRNIVPFLQAPSLPFPGTMCQYYACNDCDTVMDEGSPLVGYTESCQSCSLDSALRFYVEVGAGIDFMARILLALSTVDPARKIETQPSFLDIGCGFGFSCSLAEFRHWHPTGIEPSQMGVFGKQMLRVPILSTHIENTNLTPGQFDYVHSSEVIEHVQDVDLFVATAVRYLKPDGVLVITTPNGQTLRGMDAVEREWEESLNPGYHVHVLSPAALEMILRRNGMSSVQIILSEGSSGRKRMIAFASRRSGLPSIPWNELDTKPFVRSYLEHLISQPETSQESPVLYRGALYRLIELLANQGAYVEAETAIAKLDEALTREGKSPESYDQIRATTLEEYLNQVPAFAGLFAFYKGLVHLNHRADYSGARRWFRQALHLCTLEGTVEGSSPWYFRQDWLMKCRFHGALALLYGGRQREALHEFDALLSEPLQLPSGMQEQLLWNKGIAHLQLSENIPAFRYFADTWLKRRFADAPEQYSPLVHMTIALAQAANHTTAQLQAIENRLTGHQTHQQGISASPLDTCQDAYQRLERLTDRLEAVVARVRPVWHLARPFARRALSMARVARAGYRRLRGAARSVLNKGRAAVGLSTTEPAFPSSSLPETALGELLAGHSIEQPFTCLAEGLAGLRIKISTNHRKLSCVVKLVLRDAKGHPLREIEVQGDRFRDNAHYFFAFSPLAASRGQQYTLSLTSPDGSLGNSVVLWSRSSTNKELRIDGRRRNGELVLEPVHACSDAAATPRDLLIVCPDMLGHMRIGIGMRHWEIARALAARGLSVTLATPHPFPDDLHGDGFDLLHASSEETVLAHAAGHRCILVQGSILERFPALSDSNLPVAVDMITPMHLESFERTADEYKCSLQALTSGLQRGDFFVCGNERQRLHWLGMLAGMARLPFKARTDNPELRRVIDLVPFGVPAAAPVKTRSVLKGVRPGIGRDDFVLTWFGGIWDWLDPLPIVRAVGAAWQQDPRVKLFFSAYRRPDGVVPDMARRVHELARELGLLNRCVFFNDYPVPFDERADYLLETDAGILCQARNLETQVAARTRVLDYLWADCPLLMNDGDEWAQTIRQEGLGIIVDENRTDLWTRAILDFCRDEAGRRRMRANIARLKSRLHWTSCVEPLVQFVARNRSAETSSRLAA